MCGTSLSLKKKDTDLTTMETYTSLHVLSRVLQTASCNRLEAAKCINWQVAYRQHMNKILWPDLYYMTIPFLCTIKDNFYS